MPLPEPVPGLVIHYSYLWYDQHCGGQEEGTKERPCVVVLAVSHDDGDTLVTVAPITHTSPRSPGDAVEIPAATKARLGLDDDRSWVVVTEINHFRWPGHDLRPVPGGTFGTYAYGVLPPGLFRQVKEGIGSWVRARRLRSTPRA